MNARRHAQRLDVPEKYRGLSMKEARKAVLTDLAEGGFHDPESDVEDRLIDLAHSDRSKTPIEPYLADQWFVKMDELAQSAMDAVTDGRVRRSSPSGTARLTSTGLARSATGRWGGSCGGGTGSQSGRSTAPANQTAFLGRPSHVDFENGASQMRRIRLSSLRDSWPTMRKWTEVRVRLRPNQKVWQSPTRRTGFHAFVRGRRLPHQR